jgi:hypothetical protein
MQDVNRGEVAPWVMCGPRGAEQGVAPCTHAGPWLDSNLFVTLPVVFDARVDTVLKEVCLEIAKRYAIRVVPQ